MEYTPLQRQSPLEKQKLEEYKYVAIQELNIYLETKLTNNFYDDVGHNNLVSIAICMVPGNCDGWTSAETVKQITLGGKSILLSHGHLWGVKSGYDRAIAQARAVGADILLFGHTHQALCCQLEDGLWMLNPGSSRSTYGLITLEEGTISCSVHHQN